MPLILRVDDMQALAVKYSHDSAYQRVDGGNAAYCYLKDNREISLFKGPKNVYLFYTDLSIKSLIDSSKWYIPGIGVKRTNDL